MNSYMHLLTTDFINNYCNLEWGRKRVIAAWRRLRNVLEVISAAEGVDEWLRSFSLSLLDEMTRFENSEGKFVGLIPYVILSDRAGGGHDVTLAMNIHYGRYDIVVLTMASTADVAALAHLLIHELIHASGVVSKEEGMDELMADYLVNEVVEHSNGGIADESALTYTDKCMSGCGVLGAAAQFMINKGRWVLEREFRSNIERYLDEGIIVDFK